MKNLILLIASAALLSGCGLSFCRQNLCDSCPKPEPAPAEVKKPQPVKPAPAPTVVIESEEDEITLGATTFKYNAYDFTDEAKANLGVLIKFMSAHPKSSITVAGHTDSAGSDISNQALSEKRAAAVKDFLVANGIDAKRINTIGYGESKPIATNKTKAGRAKNRRIEIQFNKKAAK